MAILVHETAPGVFERISGSRTLTSLDGEFRAPLRTIMHESWSAEERAAYGVFEAVPFVVPEGKVSVGSERFERDGGAVLQVFDVEDIPAPTKEDLKAYAAEKRRALINGAAVVEVGEREIPAFVDPESRGSVTGLVVASQVMPGIDVSWKGADGQFYTLNDADKLSLALGMMAFVQACFVVEEALTLAIDGDAVTSLGAIDGSDWPESYEAAS